MFYIERNSQGDITGKGEISVRVPLGENQFEVTKEEYDAVSFPEPEPGEPLTTPEERITLLEQEKAQLEERIARAEVDNLVSLSALAELYEMILLMQEGV